PLRATARIPNAPARRLLGVFGRGEVIGGVLDGTIEVRGSVGDPIATVQLVGTDLRVPPGPDGTPIRVVRRITVDGDWRDGGGRLAVDAEQPGGSLKVRATGSPERPDDVTLAVTARSFDLVPLLVFAPGPFGGAGGQLDARFTVRGTDPATATIAG